MKMVIRKVDMSVYDPYGRTAAQIAAVRARNDPSQVQTDDRLKREIAHLDEALAIAARLRVLTKSSQERTLLDKLASCLRIPKRKKKKNVIYTC